MQFSFIILDFSNKVRGLRLSFCLDLWKHFVFINYGQLRSNLNNFVCLIVSVARQRL